MQKDDFNACEVFTNRLLEVQPEVKAFVAAVLAAYPDDIRDVVQETNLAMVRHAAAYHPDQRMLPWAIAFAKNQIRAYRLKHARDRLIFDETLLEEYAQAAFAPVEGVAEPSDRAQHLLKCLERLPERQRHLIHLRYEKGWSAEAIARQENHSAKAVRTALYKARQRLADCMNRSCRLGDDEPGEMNGAEDSDALAELVGLTLDALPAPRPDDFRTLISRLRDAVEVRRIYADQIFVHTLLAEHFAVENRRDEIRSLVLANRPVRQSGHFPFLRVAAGLAILLGGLAYAFYSPSGRERPAVAAPVETHSVTPVRVLEPRVSVELIQTTNRLATRSVAVTQKGEKGMKKTQAVAAVAATLTAVTAPTVLMKANIAVAASTASSPPVVYMAASGYAAYRTSNSINLETRAIGREAVTGCDLETRYRSFRPSNNSNLNSTKVHGFGVFLK